MNFAELKKNSNSSFAKLNDQLQKLNSGGYQNDNADYWYPEVDKAGNGYAVIRFLPAPPNEDMPFVRMYDHGFQGPGGWYIENSLSTIGQPDPCGEYNSKLWNEDGSNAAKEQVRKQKRRLTYHCNILVIKDPAKPENEGKVFKYKFGKKIFDKLNDLMNPQFPDEQPVNPFDFWQGANFNLKIRNVEGYRNYDKSDFSAPSALSDDDAYLESVWKQEHSLKDIIAPDKFKSYDELKARLYKVLQLDGAPTRKSEMADEDEVPREMNFKPSFKAKEESAPSSEASYDSGWKSPAGKSDDDDDLAEFFNSLSDD